MKTINYAKAVLFICLLPATAGIVHAQNQLPVISKVKVKRDEQRHTAQVSFKLKDKEEKQLSVQLMVSTDEGLTYRNINQELVQPNAGLLPAGKNKLTWNYTGQSINFNKAKFKLIVDDGYQIEPAQVLALVDTNRIRQRLVQIIGERTPETPVGLKHLNDVRHMINETWVNANYAVENQPFEFGDYQGANIIGRKAGSTNQEKLLAICAAFDTPTNTPGANSNASGLAGVLEIANVLSGLTFKNSIAVVGMDYSGEEFVGSTYFVNRGGIRPFEKLVGAIDLDRIGSFNSQPNSHPLVPAKVQLFQAMYKDLKTHDNKADFMTVLSNRAANDLAQTFVEQSSIYSPKYRVYSEVFEGNGEFTRGNSFLLQFSDHIPFWYHKLPAIMVTDARAANNSDSMPDDTIDKVNVQYMSNIIKATVATILKAGQVQHATVYVGNF
jgi:hypothetical protein